MGLVVVALVRDLMKRPWQLVLTVLSVAAGVSVVVGVDIANDSATAEFHRAGRVMDGAATHRLTGSTRALDESLYRVVRVKTGIQAAAPVISATVSIAGNSDRWTLMGVDPLSDYRLRNFHLDQRTDDPGPGGMAGVSWPLFGPAGLTGMKDDLVVLEHGGRRQAFHWVGALSIPGESESRLLVTDISWAQDFLAMQGRISYVDLRLEPGEESELRALLPADTRLIDLGIHHAARQDMSRAFRINLTALSLLALVVAMFLVYSAVSFHVIRRRQLLGLLGAMGVTGGQISLVLLFEVVLIGVFGTVSGILFGGALANVLTILVGDTINTLYHELGNPIPVLSVWTLSKALLVGLAASVFAGLAPILVAAREAPVALLHETAGSRRLQRLVPLLLPSALGCGVLAAILILLPDDSLILPFAGLFLLICALSLFGPWLLYQVSRADAFFGPGNWQLVPKVALGNAGRHLDRTGVAVAALTVAVSATLGIELMIQSFRYSVEDWLVHYLRADVYLSTGADGNEALAESFLAELRALPELRYLSTGRRIVLETESGPRKVLALDVPSEGFAGFRITEGQGPGLWDRFRKDGEVLITEPLAHRLRLSPGDRIALPTDRGVHRFPIAAVYRDYSSDHGLVTMARQTWNRFFDDARQVSAALYLTPGADVGRVIESVSNLSGTPYGMFIRSNRELRQASLAVFDHTFRITAVLRIMAVIVAVVGILSALMALLLERRREFAMLSAIGFSRRQIGGLLVLEAGMAGLTAGLMAVPLGMLLSLILIRVINVSSFGWSMESLVNWDLAWQAVALSVAAALAAAIYPAWRFQGGEVIRRLREH